MGYHYHYVVALNKLRLPLYVKGGLVCLSGTVNLWLISRVLFNEKMLGFNNAMCPYLCKLQLNVPENTCN